MAQDEQVGRSAEIVAAYVTHNSVPASELAGLIATVHAALAGLGREALPAESAAEKLTPAQIRRSITPDVLVSFEDGKPYRTLRRHLAGKGLTPEAYRAKWGLPGDYPMVAAGYSQQRSALARSLGLGRKRTATPDAESEASGAEAAAAATAPKRRGRAKAPAA